MREADRMRLLVVDACDTMSRMSDRVMEDSAKGISDHLEELLLDSNEERASDICASSLIVILALLKPLSDQMLATTDGRYSRAKVDMIDSPDDDEIPIF